MTHYEIKVDGEVVFAGEADEAVITEHKRPPVELFYGKRYYVDTLLEEATPSVFLGWNHNGDLVFYCLYVNRAPGFYKILKSELVRRNVQLVGGQSMYEIGSEWRPVRTK